MTSTTTAIDEIVNKGVAIVRQQYAVNRELNHLFMGAWRAGKLDECWADYRRTDKRCWLTYYIRARGLGDIKIGQSNHVRTRLLNLFTGASRGLDLVACYPALKSHETEVQGEFEHLRLCGEWFSPGKDLINHLRRLGADVDGFTDVVPAHFMRRTPELMA